GLATAERRCDPCGRFLLDGTGTGASAGRRRSRNAARESSPDRHRDARRQAPPRGPHAGESGVSRKAGPISVWRTTAERIAPPPRLGPSGEAFRCAGRRKERRLRGYKLLLVNGRVVDSAG